MTRAPQRVTVPSPEREKVNRTGGQGPISERLVTSAERSVKVEMTVTLGTGLSLGACLLLLSRRENKSVPAMSMSTESFLLQLSCGSLRINFLKEATSSKHLTYLHPQDAA